jgi:hypothetical protein
VATVEEEVELLASIPYRLVGDIRHMVRIMHDIAVGVMERKIWMTCIAMTVKTVLLWKIR